MNNPRLLQLPFLNPTPVQSLSKVANTDPTQPKRPKHRPWVTSTDDKRPTGSNV